MDCTHPDPLFVRSPRQESWRYWSGWPIACPGDLPNPGIKFMSPSLAGTLLTEPLRKPIKRLVNGYAFECFKCKKKKSPYTPIF